MRFRQLVLLLAGGCLVLALAGCDVLGGDETIGDVLLGEWSFEQVTVETDEGESDITNQVLQGVEESSLVFREGGTFAVRFEGQEGTVEKEGNYTVGAEADAIELAISEDGALGTLDYEIGESENRLTLETEEIPFLVDLLDIELGEFEGVMESVERAEVVLERTE